MTTTVVRRKPKPVSKTSARTHKHKRKRQVGRPRSGKVSITTTIRPDLKQFAAQIGTRTTANGKVISDVSAGIERALEFYRERHAEGKGAVDKNGWPIGFFEQTAGSIPWLVREPQGEYEVRDELQ